MMLQQGKSIPLTLDDGDYKDVVVDWLEKNGFEVTKEAWLDFMFGDEVPNEFDWPKELQE